MVIIRLLLETPGLNALCVPIIGVQKLDLAIKMVSPIWTQIYYLYISGNFKLCIIVVQSEFLLCVS